MYKQVCIPASAANVCTVRDDKVVYLSPCELKLLYSVRIIVRLTDLSTRRVQAEISTHSAYCLSTTIRLCAFASVMIQVIIPSRRHYANTYINRHLLHVSSVLLLLLLLRETIGYSDRNIATV